VKFCLGSSYWLLRASVSLICDGGQECRNLVSSWSLYYVIWLGLDLPHFGRFDFENYVCLYSSVSNFLEGVARRQRGKWVKFRPVRAFSKFCLVLSFLPYRPLMVRDPQTMRHRIWGVVDRGCCIPVG
jgi:hypothetical protein